MEKLISALDKKMIAAKCAMYNFITEERGDTNFVSIAVIVAIIVVLAIAFKGIATTAIQKIGEQVSNFIGN